MESIGACKINASFYKMMTSKTPGRGVLQPQVAALVQPIPVLYCLKRAFGHVSRLLATFPTFWGPVENFEILVGQAPLGTSLVWLRRASQAAPQLQIPARGTRSGRDIA